VTAVLSNGPPPGRRFGPGSRIGTDTTTFKRTFGYHPMVAFLDNTREALAGMLRAGKRRGLRRRSQRSTARSWSRFASMVR
jgi:hypothetical protein